MIEKGLGVVGLAVSILSCNCFSSASGLSITEKEKRIIVENPYYKAVITSEGARISSLILKKSGNNFARGWEGISETIEKPGYKGHAGMLGVETYSCKIVKESADSVKVQFTYHGKPDCLINWLMTYQKTFTFLEKSPLIKVELSLKNVGDSETFTQFRVHNNVAAGEGVDENDIYFLPTTEGMKEIKGIRYINNFTAGLAGVIDQGTKDALLFFPDYDSVKRFYFWMGGSGKKKATTIEWYYRSFVLGRGNIWQTSYFILPTTLSSLSRLQTCLKEHGIRVNSSVKVKKAQKPINISRRETELVKAGDVNSFNRLIASKPIREMAIGKGKIEKNVKMANNHIYSRSVFTETGAGYEATLPDAKDIVIEAEITMKPLADEKKEAYLACCDPAGNLYSVSEPLTLREERTEYKKSHILRLNVSELSGREVRILLYGRGVNWTGLSIVSSKGKEGMFTPISSWAENVCPRFIEPEEKDIKEPVEVFVEGLISSIPELSYEIHDTNGRVVAREKNLSMRKVHGKESLFSTKINTIPDCDVSYTITAGKEEVNNRFKFVGLWRPPLPRRKGTYYVAKDGRDSWSGRLASPNKDKTDGPFASITRARDTIRQLKKEEGIKNPVTVMVREGTYSLDKPITFIPKDSGTEKCPITYMAYPGEKVVISGGRKITGPWKVYKDKIMVCSIPEAKQGNWKFRQLFVNCEREPRSKTPNKGFYYIKGVLLPKQSRTVGEKLSFIFNKGDIKKWKNLDCAEVIVFHSWSESRLLISKLDKRKSTVVFSGPAAYPFDSFDKHPRYYVENIMEALDSPGEWYLNYESGKLYYWPNDENDINTAEIIAPALNQLIVFKGDSKKKVPVCYINLCGFTFAYTGYQLPPEGYANGGGYGGPVFRPSAILLEDAEHCNLLNNQINNVATSAVELNSHCSYNQIGGNHIRNAGGGGIIIFAAGQKNIVSYNHIHHCGQIFFGGTGIVNSKAKNTVISHNLVHDMPYCGIRGGQRDTGYRKGKAEVFLNEVIEYNHVHDVMQELDDGAGIFNAGPGTVIRNNLVHDIYGHPRWGAGIYLDERRSKVRVENNVVYNTVRNFQLHENYGNTIVNNIFALGKKEGQIYWTRFCGLHWGKRVECYQDALQTFKRNIIYYKEGILSEGLGPGREDLAKKPELIDYNLYYNVGDDHLVKFREGSFPEWQKLGFDKHSAIADPLFVDPENGNFTLKPNSPAFKLGFKPIDISKVGPKR